MDRKWRIEPLKNKPCKRQGNAFNLLFQECLEALGEGTIVLSKEKTQELYSSLQTVYPFTLWGRIDWEQIGTFQEFQYVEDIVEYIQTHFEHANNEVYIFWGYGENPVLQVDLTKIVAAIDDITAVGGDQWFYSPTHKFVVELFHDGDTRASFNNL